ncbi:MAG: integrase [Rhizobiales bacterium 63-22]|nr:MAG: integrase [Rhizobiales bacterium 63-22]
MGWIPSKKDPDRFLFLRSGNYYYRRRVPGNIAHLDERSPTIRTSLKTDDLALARSKRDLMEEADNILWASMVLNEPRDPARARYEAAMRRVEALGLTYRSSHAMASHSSLEEIVSRLETVASQRLPQELAQGVAGMIPVPAVTVGKAFEIYCDEIVPDELVNKSAVQKAQWKKVKLRAVNNFIALVTDKAMSDITRDDAMKLYRHWLERIAPKEGKPTHSASSGNRDIGNMRVLYDSYFGYIGEENRQNPFARLNFSTKKKRSRPPFPRDWLTGTIMKPGNLATLNEEARGIALALIETGARPSELANLSPSAIRLSHKVPHIAIEPRDDPDDPREIKTSSSERLVPLVGVALAVFRRHKDGFPRYRNRENDLSATLNKYFKENGLFPTPQHKIYSFRHSFEDRMKEANLDDELRRLLMGHTIERPRYGMGGSLEWRQKELKKIALPFSPTIV